MFFDFENNQRQIRRYLNLTLGDLEAATGITAARISRAERGVTYLAPAEQRIVTNFLKRKLQAANTDTIAEPEAGQEPKP